METDIMKHPVHIKKNTEKKGLTLDNMYKASSIQSLYLNIIIPQNKVVEGIMFLTGPSFWLSVLHHYVVARMALSFFVRFPSNLDEGFLSLKAWMGSIFIEICNGGHLKSKNCAHCIIAEEQLCSPVCGCVKYVSFTKIL